MNKTGEVKKYLENGGRLTNIGAYDKFGTTRLGSIIHRLRKDYGMNIITVMKEKPDRYGNMCSYAEYHLEK